MNLRARLSRLEAAARRTIAKRNPRVYFIPKWPLPRMKDGGDADIKEGDAIFVMSRPGDSAGRGRV